MQVYRLKRSKTFGSHNFDPFQINVCHLNHIDGRVMKGISIVGSGNELFEIPLAMNEQDIQSFRSFLENILNDELPQKIKVKGGFVSMFTTLRLSVKKIVDNPGQYTYYKGSSFYGYCLGGYFNTLRIPKESAEACLMSLEAMSEAET